MRRSYQIQEVINICNKQRPFAVYAVGGLFFVLLYDCITL